jgi:hypothetical protein
MSRGFTVNVNRMLLRWHSGGRVEPISTKRVRALADDERSILGGHFNERVSSGTPLPADPEARQAEIDRLARTDIPSNKRK